MIKKRYTIILTILDVLAAIFVLLIPLISKYMVDEALKIANDSNQSYDKLIVYLVLIGILLLLAIVIHIVSNFTYSKFYLDNERDLKNKLQNSLMDKPIKDLEKFRTGDIEVLYEQDIFNILRKYLQTIPSIITSLTRAIVAFAFLIIVDETKYKFFAIAIVLLGIVAAILAKIYSKVIKKHHQRVLNADSNASAFMVESYENSKLVKSYLAEDRIKGYYSNLNDIARKEKGKRNLVIYSASSFVYAFTSIVYVLAMTLGALLIAKNIFSYGSLIAIIQLINKIESPFMSMSSYLNQYHLGSASEARINDIIMIKNEEYSELKDFNEIIFDNVSFYYDTDKYIISDLSFNIKKGSVTKIKGPSGIGKTTLFMLLLGFLKPTNGNIYFDSTKASKSTRGLISYVSVDNILFSISIKENIYLLTGVTDEKRIIDALKFVNLYDELLKLDGNINYKLTKGKGLSEGQMERLSIAISILNDKPILLLDEATSALDINNENIIINNLLSLGKTIIYITHKRDFTQNDNIIDLEKVFK